MKCFWAVLRTVVVAMVMLFGSIIALQPASASDDGCEAGFGTKVPVLLVHGLNSGRRMWSDGVDPMTMALREIELVSVVTPFDYSGVASEWIGEESGTGRKLAEHIDCLAQASRRNGGRGKVVVVAHSMGGLATRFAANEMVDGRNVADELGLVVTLGTPHLGSGYGTLCRTWAYTLGSVEQCSGSAPKALAEGSPELRALPHFPSNVAVRAIAGRVTAHIPILFGYNDVDQGGDKVVSVESATNEYTNDEKGGGKFVFSCQGSAIYPKDGDADCEHVNMYKTGYIQESVTNGIRDYLAATPLANGTPYTFFKKMTLQLPDGLHVQPVHGEGPSAYLVGCGEPAACLQFSVYSPAEVGGSLNWQEWDLPECAAAVDTDDTSLSRFGPIALKGERQVGGKPAKYYEAELCVPGVSQETARFWEVKDGDILIMTTDSEGEWRDKMDGMLAAATWQ